MITSTKKMDLSLCVPPSDSDEEYDFDLTRTTPQRVYDFGEESTSDNQNYMTLLSTSVQNLSGSPMPSSSTNTPESTPASSLPLTSVSSQQSPVSSPQYSSSGSSPTNSESPPSPRDYLYNDSDSYDEDKEILDDDNDDDFGIPLQPPPSFPMVNYSRDVEHELDYEMGY